MDAPTLRERRKQELRARLLDEARALFVKIGYEAFSMRKLAETVGCSAGNLYLYFRSREDLFRCLIDQSFAELEHAVGQSLTAERAKGADPVVQLKRGLRAYVEFGVTHPDPYRVAFLVRRPSKGGVGKPHAAFDILRAVVKRCVAARSFRATDVELASQALWAAVHGVTSLLIQVPRFPWVEREDLIARVIDSAVDPLTRARKGRT
jgi:AcrR family transcriptional regulator